MTTDSRRTALKTRRDSAFICLRRKRMEGGEPRTRGLGSGRLAGSVSASAFSKNLQETSVLLSCKHQPVHENAAQTNAGAKRAFKCFIPRVL